MKDGHHGRDVRDIGRLPPGLHKQDIVASSCKPSEANNASKAVTVVLGKVRSTRDWRLTRTAPAGLLQAAGEAD